MRIADLKFNDVVDCENGFCVSLWMQGCPHRCKGCHNPQTWDYLGGYEISRKECLNQIINNLFAFGIERSFSILGGEPLCEENIYDVEYILKETKKVYPQIKVYLWTGYTIEELKERKNKISQSTNNILKNVDILIEGRYIKELRDIRLPLRGSSNQRVIKFKN